MTPGAKQPNFNPYEARVFGVLVEKSMTTPDQYPLSLNAATSGANQKSNRDPVVDYLEAEVDVALQGLVLKGFAGRIQPAGSRVEKFRHNGHERLGLGDAELAVLAELLMRGPQTPGELRGRAHRMTPVATLQELAGHLESLGSRGFVQHLPPAAGSRKERYGQTLVPGLHPVEAGEAAPPAAPAQSAAVPGLAARVEILEREVGDLKDRLGQLLIELGASGSRADS